METNAEIAKRYEDARERGEELTNLVPVKARTPRHAESIYSLRLTAEEMSVITEAARREKMKVSQFIRNAALRSALGGAPASAAEDPAIRAELASIRSRLERYDERADQIEEDMRSILNLGAAPGKKTSVGRGATGKRVRPKASGE